MKWKDKLKFFQKQNLFRILIFFIFIISSFIKEPWHDELYTQYVAKKPLVEIFNEIKKDSGPPFYYFLIHFLTLPFKHTIFSIRFLSSIFVIFSGIFLIKTLNSNYGLFILLFPIPFYFSSEARCYSLIIFLSSLFFYEILSKKRIFFITIYLILLSYTHYISILYFSYLIFLIIYEKGKKYILSSIIYLISIIPLYFLFASQPKESIFWASPFLNWKSLFNFFSNLGPNLFENYVYNFFPPLPVFIFFILNIYIIYSNFKTKPFLKILIPFFLNIFSLFAFSYLYKNIYIPSRTESFFFVPFSLFLINLILKNFKYIKYIKIFYTFSLMFSLIFIFLSFIKGIPINKEIEKITNYIKEDTRICVIGYWRLTIEYMLQKKGLENEVITFPISQNEHQGWHYVNKLNDEDLNWFSKNIILSKNPHIILVDKNNPFINKILPLFSEDIKIHNTENLYFIVKD